MVGAARSARQNIVEASSRAATSKEQELKQLDVAKGSLDELAGDYEAIIVDRGQASWSNKDANYQVVRGLQLDPFTAMDDVDHEYDLYTLSMRRRCASWLENPDPLVAANAILITIRRACALLTGQMRRTADDFTAEGGFTERLSKARLAARDAAVQAAGAPKCPKCGKPMRKPLSSPLCPPKTARGPRRARAGVTHSGVKIFFQGPFRHPIGATRSWATEARGQGTAAGRRTTCRPSKGVSGQ